MHAALVGFGLGFLVAVQVGPMSLFLIRSTLRRGLVIGLSIGAGIALTDALYASLGVAGAAPLVSIEAGAHCPRASSEAPCSSCSGGARSTARSACGAGERPTSSCPAHGVRSQPRWRRPRPTRSRSSPGPPSSPGPLPRLRRTRPAARRCSSPASPRGACLWFVALSLGVASIRRGVGERAMRIADCVAGLGLIGFGGLLLYEGIDR